MTDYTEEISQYLKNKNILEKILYRFGFPASCLVVSGKQPNRSFNHGFLTFVEHGEIHPINDCELNFGPCSIMLSELYKKGWQISCEFDLSDYFELEEKSSNLSDVYYFHSNILKPRQNMSSKLILSHPNHEDRYVIKKSITLKQALFAYSFSEYISETKNFLLTKHVEKNNKVEEFKIETDDVNKAFDVLNKKYTPPSKNKMVGNMTINEYVKQQLKGI